jgi:4-hydroxyphenylpyruvate dioxygenase-like putative hemolysin
MKMISKNNTKNNNYITIIDSIDTSMTDDEYEKAVEFYKFLVSITKCTHGFLNIERKKLISIASAYMECTPMQAHNILMKMKAYGWIKILESDYIIVNLEKTS